MRRAQDLCRIAENRGVARYSGFLSDREQSLAKAALYSLEVGPVPIIVSHAEDFGC